jgi:tRNA-specific 2-thiouridylase
LEHSDKLPSLNDIELLKVGRHFRVTHDAKLVVGRNKEENEVIKALANDNDIIIEVMDYVGPTCLLRCKNYDRSLLTKCAAIAARYSDAPKLQSTKVSITISGNTIETIVPGADLETIRKLRI